VTAVQLDLFGQITAHLTGAEQQQADWHAWLQNELGQWRCPACGDREESAGDLYDLHGWQTELEVIGHPYFYAWPGRYAEGGYSGNGGRCKKLRLEWLAQRYGDATYRTRIEPDKSSAPAGTIESRGNE
jgi:hypothetical protein